MEKKIDYLGIRHVYERAQNRRGLDRLVQIYCATTYDETPNECDPVLKNIEVSEDAIKEISNNGLLALIISGAKPQDALLEETLTNHSRTDNAFYLLFRKLITVKTFKKTIRPTENYKTISRIISTLDLSSFEGLDMKELESDLLWEWNPTKCDATRINTALLFLKRIPYNEYHCSLAIRICKTLQKSGDSKEKETALKEFKYFIDKRIPSTLKGNDLVETLFARPDYQSLLANLPKEMSFKAVFYENEENDYDSKVSELASLICKGNISHPAFALDFFKELMDYRITILNYWAANDMALELDIYGPNLMLGTCPQPELDDIYIEEKTKKGTIGEEKKHDLQPADKKG